jgi:hypothetical protein
VGRSCRTKNESGGCLTNRISAKGGLCLYCIECDALRTEYRLATERYTVLAGMLEMTNIPEAFPDLELQELKNHVDEAQISCHRARNALSAHRETLVCNKCRPSQHRRGIARHRSRAPHLR